MSSKQEDDKIKTPKKSNKKITKIKTAKSKKKRIEESDSDSDSDWLPEERSVSEDSTDEEDEEEDMDTLEMQRFIQKIFPSKSGKKRMDQLDKIDELIDKKENIKKSKKTKKTVNSKKRTSAKKRVATNVEEDEDDEEEDEEECDYDVDDGVVVNSDGDIVDTDMENMLGKNMKFNIIFTVADTNEFEEESEEESEEEESSNLLKKRDKSKIKYKVNDKVLVKALYWEEESAGIITKVCTRNRYNIKLDDKDLDQRCWKLIGAKYIRILTEEDTDYMNNIKQMKELVSIKKTKGNEAMLKKLECFAKADTAREKKKEDDKVKKDKLKNAVKLKKLLKEKNVMNDFKYFKDMEIEDQRKILKKLEEVNKYSNVEKPYRLALLDSDIPIAFKSAAMKKINILEYMEPGSGEYYKNKQWVDAFMRIPFNKHNTLPVSIKDGRDKCSDFMENAKKTLDECVYGLNDAKMQIMQFIGQWISNPNSVGSALAIKGPPGTGKTTLIKEGISKILQRPFAFLALGGATDSSFLEGHSYTYEGSSWGKIVDILIQSKSMNPVIYFDELDKISETPKGEEITGILTHLTDTTQNTQFHDKYFSNVDFDLSKVLFIFSYNDESKINPVLKDRMYRIHTKGYETKEKLIIAKDHLIPKIEKNINFEVGQLVIPDETLSFIVETYTEKERGVRNLKRCLEILYTKINLYTLMKPDSSLFDGEVVLKVEFPYTITPDIVKKLIKVVDKKGAPFGMYL
jgi:ATP-dependent Lon protease